MPLDETKAVLDEQATKIAALETKLGDAIRENADLNQRFEDFKSTVSDDMAKLFAVTSKLTDAETADDERVVFTRARLDNVERKVFGRVEGDDSVRPVSAPE